MQKQTMQINTPIQCSHCTFETMSGKAMYDHLWSKHDMFFHDMKYAMSWRVGTNNTYTWLMNDNTSLDVDSLRKCNHCKKPHIAPNGNDECEDCKKLPQIRSLLKYSYNRADYENVNHYTKICKRCGAQHADIGEHRKHGELKEVDGILQHVCESKN